MKTKAINALVFYYPDNMVKFNIFVLKIIREGFIQVNNKTINSRIQNKKDSSADWEINNPILLNGEIAIVETTNGIKMKIGDGLTNYIDLPFFLDNILTEIENKIKSATTIPSGMIMIWSGSQSEIPYGWVLCNGQNGTPDLTDKFVIGAGTSYNVNDEGGEASHTLTIDEIPTHSHGSNYPVVPDSSGGGVEGYVWNFNSYDYGKIGTTASGGGQSHNNMPPYYSLCYIMKV